MSWKFEIITAPDELKSTAFVDEWTNMITTAQCSHVFFHPALVKAWIDTYSPLRHLEPFVVKATDGVNKALLPMVRWHRNWKNAFLNVIVPIGYSDFDYHDPIFCFQPTEESLKSYWHGLIDILKNTFSFDSLIIDGVTDTNALPTCQWTRGEMCPLLNLEGIHSETELMAFFKTSLRGDIRRQIRRLEEIAPLSHNEYPSWEDIPRGTFSEFMRRHAARWPKAYKAPRFHENLLRQGLKAGVAHFSTLSVGDTEIAWHLGFTFRGRYYYYMPAGNEEFLKYSPTKIHLFYLVRRAVENGYAVYDHLRGEETYKSGWSNGCQYVNTFQIQSNGISARTKNCVLKMRGLLS